MPPGGNTLGARGGITPNWIPISSSAREAREARRQMPVSEDHMTPITQQHHQRMDRMEKQLNQIQLNQERATASATQQLNQMQVTATQQLNQMQLNQEQATQQLMQLVRDEMRLFRSYIEMTNQPGFIRVQPKTSPSK